MAPEINNNDQKKLPPRLSVSEADSYTEDAHASRSPTLDSTPTDRQTSEPSDADGSKYRDPPSFSIRRLYGPRHCAQHAVIVWSNLFSTS